MSDMLFEEFIHQQNMMMTPMKPKGRHNHSNSNFTEDKKIHPLQVTSLSREKTGKDMNSNFTELALASKYVPPKKLTSEPPFSNANPIYQKYSSSYNPT